MAIVVIGVNHRTAPIDLLERVAITADDLPKALRDLGQRANLSEAVVLATCNRTEAYGFGSGSPAELGEQLSRVLREVVGPARFPEREHMYHSHGVEGARHLFRVACGLDSMFLGEAQILGQLKEAYEQGARHLPAGPVFDRLLQSAFRVAARTRTDTEARRACPSRLDSVARTSSSSSDTGRVSSSEMSSCTTGRR